MHRPQRGFMIVLVAIMGLLDATTVHARRVSAQVAVVRTAIAEVRTLQASLDWPDGAEAGQLRIDVARIDAPLLGRSAERRVGHECGRTCISRCSPYL